MYVQVTLHSQVKATLTVYDAWLDLQDLFMLDKVMEDQFLAFFHLSYLQLQKQDSYSVYTWGRELLKVWTSVFLDSMRV